MTDLHIISNNIFVMGVRHCATNPIKQINVNKYKMFLHIICVHYHYACTLYTPPFIYSSKRSKVYFARLRARVCECVIICACVPVLKCKPDNILFAAVV